MPPEKKVSTSGPVDECVFTGSWRRDLTIFFFSYVVIEWAIYQASTLVPSVLPLSVFVLPISCAFRFPLRSAPSSASQKHGRPPPREDHLETHRET